MAMKPLVVLAKHILSPEAEPMLEVMCFTLRVVAKCEPFFGASESLCGPEVGMLQRSVSH